MPRSLTVYQKDRLGDTITKPIRILELHFDPIIRVSTRNEVDWSGTVFFPNLYHVIDINLNFDKGGDITGHIEFSNYNNIFSSFVLNQKAKNRVVKIWDIHADQDSGVIEVTPGTDDPVPLFEGTMNGADIGDTVRLNIVSYGANRMFAPGIYCNTLMEFLPEAGTKIRWGNTEITLIPDRTR